MRVTQYIRRHHIGMIALFVALTGTAYAGTQVANRPANPQVLKTKKKARPIPGPAGPAGAPGPAGPAGAQGATGAPGSPAASMLTGHFNDQYNGISTFAAPSGETDGFVATAEGAAMLSPAATVVARDLFVRRMANSDLTRTTTLNVDGSDTALTCTIAVGTASCSDTTHAVSIPPGSSLVLHYENDGSGGTGIPPDMQFGWRATTP